MAARDAPGAASADKVAVAAISVSSGRCVSVALRGKGDAEVDVGAPSVSWCYAES